VNSLRISSGYAMQDLVKIKLIEETRLIRYTEAHPDALVHVAANICLHLTLRSLRVKV